MTCSVHHTEHPKWNLVAEANLQIIGSNKTVWQVLDLSEPFICPADLEKVSAIHFPNVQKVSLQRKEITKKLSFQGKENAKILSLERKSAPHNSIKKDNNKAHCDNRKQSPLTKKCVISPNNQ